MNRVVVCALQVADELLVLVRTMRRLLLPFAFAASGVPAQAQETGSPPSPPPEPVATPGAADAVMARSVFAGNFLVVGVGAVVMPDYEGSNDGRIRPAGMVYGRLGGVGISPRAAGLALNFIPDAKGQRVEFSLGPVLRYRRNRNGSVADPVVARLGKLDAVVESGVAVGVTLKGVFHAHDRISAGTDLRWDISGHGSGRVITPGVSYFTPVGKGQIIGARAGAEFIDDQYASYNYAIGPAGSAASGLEQYRAHGGLKEWNAGVFTAFDLDGNFLDGGFSLGVAAQYAQLYGSAAATPITSIRGNRDQWYVGAGIGYTF
jgi:outer membrane scaffolding protein for murein synthesis (MipA/OmpV family)